MEKLRADDSAADTQAQSTVHGVPQVVRMVSRTPEDNQASQAKRSGRGMSERRRIGLKIEADESENAAKAHRQVDTQGADAKQAPNGEDWWKHEYRAPPPGHLGAHSVPVVATIAEASMRNTVDATEGELKRMEVTATQVPSDRPQIHETPERANRRVRGGAELYDASTSHSSPNQKRKIIDLQDCEAGTFPSMSVAKELKRFHETSEEQHTHQNHHESDEELASPRKHKVRDHDVVTPSKLVRPLTKIDIQAGSSSSIRDNTSGGALMGQARRAKAPESA